MLIAGLATQMNAQLDTTGLSGWDQMYNSMASWEEGAFSAHATTHPDYGWGTYNMLTHGLVGDSIYIVKLLDGNYKKLWIREKKSIANRYLFWYSDLDGSNEMQIDLAINDYSTKHFVNYSLSGDSIVATQPEYNSWDLVLTRFLQPELGYYTVTGFVANEDVSISVYSAPDSVTAATATIADTTTFTDSIAAIGNGWYKLDNMSIVPLDTLVYFIKVATGEIYKLQMTYFESGYSGKGRVGIRKQRLTGIPQNEFVHDTLVMGSFYAGDVHFSMSVDTKYLVNRANWEIGFKTAQFSSSIRANSVSGVELYTYPNADGTIWGPAVSTGPSISGVSDLSIYPVPATDHIFIRHRLSTPHTLNLSVYDLTGKLMVDRTVETNEGTEMQLDISSLNPGIYMMQIQNSEFRAVRKFTVR